MDSEYNAVVSTARSNTPQATSGHSSPQPWQPWGTTACYALPVYRQR